MRRVMVILLQEKNLGPNVIHCALGDHAEIKMCLIVI